MSIKKLKKETEEIIKIQPRKQEQPILFEIAWEVCNQVGGIYTVIRSKVPAMVEEWGDNYCLIGPYFPQTALVEFEEQPNDDSVFARTAARLREQGLDVHYGRWLVTGRPRIILVDFNKMISEVDGLKFNLWQNHKISTLHAEPLVDRVVDTLRSLGDTVETGRFRTDMLVELVNDGPVTIIIDTRNRE